jgi:hypothetical protein
MNLSRLDMRIRPYDEAASIGGLFSLGIRGNDFGLSNLLGKLHPSLGHLQKQ